MRIADSRAAVTPTLSAPDTHYARAFNTLEFETSLAFRVVR